MERNYILSNIEVDLHQEFKAACAFYGLSMREVLIKHMENIVKDYRQRKSEFATIKTYIHEKGEK